MKNITSKLSMIILAIVMLSSCKKKDDSDNASTTGIHHTIKEGTWKVSLFQEDSTDETGDFNGYSFQFMSNGSVTVNNGTNTVTGTWSSWNDSGKTKFELYFGTVSPLEELNEDWDVLEYNASVIRLKHISGGNGGVDYLNYEKI